MITITLAINICKILKEQGITGIFADSEQCEDYKIYSDNLLQNLQVHMLGCDFGIGIYKEEEQSLISNDKGRNSQGNEGNVKPQINPNMSFEVGFMMASGKRVIPIKDSKLPKLTADMQGSLYLEYDKTKLDAFESALRIRLEDLGIIKLSSTQK